MNRWRWAWLAWGLLFFAIEVPASLNKSPEDTLSEQIWSFLGFGRAPGSGVWLRRLLLLAVWCWLTAHFFFEVDGPTKGTLTTWDRTCGLTT